MKPILSSQAVIPVGKLDGPQPIKLPGRRNPGDPGQAILEKACDTGEVVWIDFYGHGSESAQPYTIKRANEPGILYEVMPKEKPE